jgi:hypothetical protein
MIFFIIPELEKIIQRLILCLQILLKIKLIFFQQKKIFMMNTHGWSMLFRLILLKIVQISFFWIKFFKKIFLFFKKRFWFQILDRKQERHAIVIYDIDKEKFITAVEEQTKYWINVKHNAIYFYGDGSDDLIYATQNLNDDGLRHLHLFKFDKQQNIYKINKQLTGFEFNKNEKNNLIENNEKETKWEINNFWVDEKNEKIYFTSNKDIIIQENLYLLNLKDLKIKKITNENYFYYNFNFNFFSNKCICERSSFKSNVETLLINLEDIEKNDKFNFNLVEFMENYETRNLLFSNILKSNQKQNFFNFRNSNNDLIFGQVILPVNYDKNKSYGMVLYVYR